MRFLNLYFVLIPISFHFLWHLSLVLHNSHSFRSGTRTRILLRVSFLNTQVMYLLCILKFSSTFPFVTSETLVIVQLLFTGFFIDFILVYGSMKLNACVDLQTIIKIKILNNSFSPKKFIFQSLYNHIAPKPLAPTGYLFTITVLSIWQCHIKTINIFLETTFFHSE